MRILVYSINLGGYDHLHQSPKSRWKNIEDDFEYLYFTDGEAPDGWTKVSHETGTRKDSRYLKINSHLLPPHDISIYVDAAFIFTKPLQNILELIDLKDIALAPHGKDNCVYKHGITVIMNKLDEPYTVFKQLGRYANEGMPTDLGLTENGFIIRRNNGIIKELNELWWQEYQQGSQRDQLSLPYALWKVQPELTLLPFSLRSNKYFSNFCNHK
jgi:hypothetical protein